MTIAEQYTKQFNGLTTYQSRTHLETNNIRFEVEDHSGHEFESMFLTFSDGSGLMVSLPDGATWEDKTIYADYYSYSVAETTVRWCEREVPTIDELHIYLTDHDGFEFVNNALDNNTHQLLKFDDDSVMVVANWETPDFVGTYAVYEEGLDGLFVMEIKKLDSFEVTFYSSQQVVKFISYQFNGETYSDELPANCKSEFYITDIDETHNNWLEPVFAKIWDAAIRLGADCITYCAVGFAGGTDWNMIKRLTPFGFTQYSTLSEASLCLVIPPANDQPANDEPTTTMEVHYGKSDDFSVAMEKVAFDDVVWTGDAHFVIGGTTAIVVHYMAETIDERPIEEGRKAVIRAVKIAHPTVTDVLFSNSIEE